METRQPPRSKRQRFLWNYYVHVMADTNFFYEPLFGKWNSSVTVSPLDLCFGNRLFMSRAQLCCIHTYYSGAPPFWFHPTQTLAGKHCPETLTGRKSEAFRPMGSFLAAGITDGSVLVKEVEEPIGGLWTGSGCRRNWDKSSSRNSLALV